MSIIDSILNVFLGDKGKKDVKEVTPIVNSVIKFEEELSKISNDQLRSITQEFKDDDTLSMIQQARAKNNVNWMALLRICVEKDPEISKKIIKEILCLDREISDLTAKLVEE